jgi:hypothetical protein
MQKTRVMLFLMRTTNVRFVRSPSLPHPHRCDGFYLLVVYVDTGATVHFHLTTKMQKATALRWPPFLSILLKVGSTGKNV